MTSFQKKKKNTSKRLLADAVQENFIEDIKGKTYQTDTSLQSRTPGCELR